MKKVVSIANTGSGEKFTLPKDPLRPTTMHGAFVFADE